MAVTSSLRKGLKRVPLITPDALPEFDDHESVMFVQDAETGLRGFIAIHNSNRGPAVGGTRFWRYDSEVEALRDALRLSRAMTYKCALADVPYGGGKCVLMAPEDGSKDEAYLKAYAKRLEAMSCGFYTGEDVGLNEEDIKILGKHSSCIIGRPDVGDLPSHWAALSVFYSMQAAMEHAFGSNSFVGKTIAIKGLGNVGLDLAQMVSREGASVIGADIRPERVQMAKQLVPNIRIISAKEIHKVATDIYAPCALGDEFTSKTIPQLKARIICGGANNQLSTEEDGDRLARRNILYIPDYVANAGGLINVVDELHSGGYKKARVEDNVKAVRKTVLEILRKSSSSGRSTGAIADAIARQRVEKARK